MKVLGVVRSTNTGKGGLPVARVQPLMEVAQNDWRAIDARREFPTHGKVSWNGAREAAENTLVFFDAEENPGHKDQYRVAEPHLAIEVVDLRALGSPVEVRRALAEGHRRHGLATGRALLVWCAPDILIGPVRLARSPTGLVTFEASKRERIPSFTSGGGDEVRTVHDGRTRRMLLATAPLRAPSGFVDWDEDRLFLRRALTAAVERAKRSGPDPNLTMKLIGETADAVVAGGTGAEVQLERYRLERARALFADMARVKELAAEFDVLLDHPAVMGLLRERARCELEIGLRAELEDKRTEARAELTALEMRTARARDELAAKADELERVRQEIGEAREIAARKLSDAEAELTKRFAEVMERPTALLAEVAMLRPFLPKPSDSARASTGRVSSGRLSWPRSASAIGDGVALRQALTTAFKARGVAPAPGLRLHAAIVAGLVPIITGSCGLAALAAYAHATCGGRLCILHVSPGFMQPLDLLGSTDVQREIFCPHPNGLLSAAQAADGIESLSLVVCEGINRGPAESYLVPLLQLLGSELGVSIPFNGDGEGGQTLKLPKGLRLAGTAVAGATCVPVSRDLWAHAVAIDVQASPTTAPATVGQSSEVLLSSELLVPADIPNDVVEELLDAWPPARDSRDTIERFGAAMRRFENDQERIKAALVDCVLLPVLTTANEEERAIGLDALQRSLEGSGNEAHRLTNLERRLHWRLA
jgi:hypothetical protein